MARLLIEGDLDNPGGATRRVPSDESRYPGNIDRELGGIDTCLYVGFIRLLALRVEDAGAGGGNWGEVLRIQGSVV